MASVRTRRAITESEIALRNSLWSDAPSALWDRTVYGGFTTLPKTYPYIAKIMDDLSKGFPLSSTYLALWCSTWDNAFVRLNRPADMAFAAGFSGERAERTWTDRLKRLENLGFVETKPSGASKFGFAFIPNPHGVIFKLYAAKSDPSASADVRELASGLTEAAFNAFVERALEIGANDVKDLLAPPKVAPAPKAKKGMALRRKPKLGGVV